jgi:hypothetical protein
MTIAAEETGYIGYVRNYESLSWCVIPTFGLSHSLQPRLVSGS